MKKQNSTPANNPRPVQTSRPAQNSRPVQNTNAARPSGAAAAPNNNYSTKPSGKGRKPHNKKLWNSISAVFLVLLVACEGWGFYRLWHLAVLPTKILAVLGGIAAVFTVLLGIMMFPKIGRHQKSRCIGRRIVAYILSLLISVGAVFGGRALGKLDQTFDVITQAPTISAYVGIFVKADDPIDDIKDASRYTFAITDSYDPENTQKAIDELADIWGTPVLTRSYPTVFAMIDGLYNGEVQGIILNEAYLGMLSEVEGYADFDQKTKRIHQYSVLAETEPTTMPVISDEPTESTASHKDSLYAPFLVYLSGSDTRDDKLASSSSRSDVNIIAVVNPETKQVLLINTPRDYYIPNPAYGNRNDKLTHCGLNGPKNSAKALSQLYDQKIAYTAQINFTGFRTLIDSIGGIDIYADKGDGVFLQAGNNHMNGETALDFARDRYDYAAGDNARGQHQMQVIKAVIEKLASGSIITNYSDILDSLQGMFVTSLPSEHISELIKMQLEDMAKWNVQSFAVTGTGGYDIPAAMGVSAYVMYPHKEDVKYASELIDRVMNDEILTEQDVQPKQ